MLSSYQNKTENSKNKLTLRNEDNVMHSSKIIYLLGINCYRNSLVRKLREKYFKLRKKHETWYKCLSTYSEYFFWESHAHMSRECWRQHFLGKNFFLQNPKYHIPLERYFNADSKNGLPHIKKIISSKVTAILRRHNDVIIFLRKNAF